MSWEPEPIPQIGWPIGLTYLLVGLLALIVLALFCK